MLPYLAQHTNSIHSQRVMSGTQLWLSEPIPKCSHVSLLETIWPGCAERPIK